MRLPRLALLLAALAFLAAGSAVAQVPVDEDGNPVEALDETGAADSDAAVPADETPEYTQGELEELVGPIALYPDDLLAVVLPAATYPLEIVQAARFLEEVENDSSLEPDESWDESVVALLNYPEVVQMMNDDLDWTWQLGEAVVAQQPDVIAAIESFRDRAYAAGNLESDDRQTVKRNDDGAIEIDTVEDEIIYVPYYEPERVVVRQPRPVYYYYPQAYPVYYYPYPAHYRFGSRYFWGVTTAFRIGWSSHHLHVFHPTYWGHPYYGHHYVGHFYRRPSISVHNRFYVNNHVRHARHNHRDGDFWRPRREGGARPGHNRDRIAHFRERRRERTTEGYRQRRSAGDARPSARSEDGGRQVRRRPGFNGGAETRREGSDTATRRGFAANRDTATAARRRAERSDDDAAIRFRPRQRTSNSTRRAREDNRAAAEQRRAPRSSRGSPSTRNPSARESSRSSDARKRPDATARPSVRSPRSSATKRPDTTRRSAPRSDPQHKSTPRSRPAQRSSAPPRRSTSRSTSTPRASSPRQSSTPRAKAPRQSSPPRAPAPRSSASTPRKSAKPAPSRESRAAPARRSSRGNRTRTRRR